MLVGFFLAGLVIHGGLQGWWLEPVLGRLTEYPLLIGATVLTAFNDNAAVTYLATLVPNLSDALKTAVVSGAIAGGGLTVIANAPNPAGQSLLQKYFPDGGIKPGALLLAALLPTLVMLALFALPR
jgi:predicted cation transporter